MYNLLDKYKIDKVLDKSNFIPKEESSQKKKKLRENLLKVKILAQIEGEDIPSYITDNYNAMVIVFLEIKVKDIRQVEFINNIVQKELKVFTIIKFVDELDNIILGYGYKRLNETNKKEIVLEKTIITNAYKEVFIDENYNKHSKYLDFNEIINKNNKLDFYLENMGKAYLIKNIESVKLYQKLLKSNLWYSRKNILNLIHTISEIEKLKQKDKKIKLTSEKMKVNKNLVKLMKKLEELINE